MRFQLIIELKAFNGFYTIIIVNKSYSSIANFLPIL